MMIFLVRNLLALIFLNLFDLLECPVMLMTLMGHVITGNLKIISDSRIRSILAKGPKITIELTDYMMLLYLQGVTLNMLFVQSLIPNLVI